jgi:hypothetical protein
LMVVLFKLSKNSISFINISMIKAYSHFFEICWIFIAFDNLHLN